jgi:tetratricopeptide (TPR) repeat protein
VRVLSPAVEAYRHDYDGSLVEHSVPIYQGADVTYTTNRRWAADLYFRIPKGHRPWIAALDKEGRGLVHTSTDRLLGRKMFNWGVDTGGQRWQSFLAEPNHAYIEIQGGLAQTQGEYVAMPAHAKWSWLEAYGLLEAVPAKVHSREWNTAHEAADRALEELLPHQRMNEELDRSAAIADRAPVELLHEGSGWGALERHRKRSTTHDDPTPFPDSSLTEDQLPWLALLQTGELPFRPPTENPGSLMVQPEWGTLLERSVEQGKSNHWLAWYHLGVMRFRANDRAGAREAWRHSLKLAPSVWATRDLAVLAREENDMTKSTTRYLEAAALDPSNISVAIECAGMLINANRAQHAIAFIDSLPETSQANGRIRLLRATAALAVGDLDAVARYFEGDVDIPNIREKETALSDLWFGLHAAKLARQRDTQVTDALRKEAHDTVPPPARFDFRLNAELS